MIPTLALIHACIQACTEQWCKSVVTLLFIWVSTRLWMLAFWKQAYPEIESFIKLNESQ